MTAHANAVYISRMNDFEIWWKNSGLNRFKSYSGGELVVIRSVCLMAWNAALEKTATDLEHAGEIKIASHYVRKRIT